jgi:hypothetical protein
MRKTVRQLFELLLESVAFYSITRAKPLEKKPEQLE